MFVVLVYKSKQIILICQLSYQNPHQCGIFSINHLSHAPWTQSDLAKAMNKRESEISKWLGGGHNFTIATIAKIEVALGEDILSVKHYRKPVSGYNALPESRKRLLSEKADKYRKAK